MSTVGLLNGQVHIGKQAVVTVEKRVAAEETKNAHFHRPFQELAAVLAFRRRAETRDIAEHMLMGQGDAELVGP
ncbi:MAG: hypothetical protein V1912_04630 [bacterium]